MLRCHGSRSNLFQCQFCTYVHFKSLQCGVGNDDRFLNFSAFFDVWGFVYLFLLVGFVGILCFFSVVLMRQGVDDDGDKCVSGFF